MKDVVAVNLETNVVRVISASKSEDNAEAIICMAVGRRGCDEEFFAAPAAGKYKDGDVWAGE